MLDFLGGMEFGHRLFAQNKWWIKVRYIRDGFYTVVHPDAIMPAPILLVKQTTGDALYQDILFQSFDKVKFMLKNKYSRIKKEGKGQKEEIKFMDVVIEGKKRKRRVDRYEMVTISNMGTVPKPIPILMQGEEIFESINGDINIIKDVIK